MQRSHSVGDGIYPVFRGILFLGGMPCVKTVSICRGWLCRRSSNRRPWLRRRADPCPASFSALQGGRNYALFLLSEYHASDLPRFNSCAISSLLPFPARYAPVSFWRRNGGHYFRHDRKKNFRSLAPPPFWWNNSLEWFSMPFLLTFLLSACLGFLTGLGVGGGSLLMIWLTLACKMDYPTAKYMNLLFFFPPALIATFANLLQGKIKFRKVLPAILAGCFSAGFFCVLSEGWDTGLLRKLFGVLLLFSGIRELCRKKSEKS